jgi:hypothetical protein
MRWCTNCQEFVTFPYSHMKRTHHIIDWNKSQMNNKPHRKILKSEKPNKRRAK